jgi:hypothetical protein
MSMKKTTTTLLTLFVVLFAFNALAVTVDQLNDSPLSDTQKGKIAQLLIEKMPAEADKAFEEALAKIESDKLQSMVTVAADKAAAELVVEQENTWNTLLPGVKEAKTHKDVWLIAQAHVDSVGHQTFVSNKLAKRYHLEGDFETIVAVQAAHELRAAARKVDAELEAKIKKIADRGDKAEASRRISADNNTADIFVIVIAKVDSLETAFATMRTDMDAMMKIQNDHEGNFEDYKEFILHAKVRKEIDPETAAFLTEIERQNKERRNNTK